MPEAARLTRPRVAARPWARTTRARIRTGALAAVVAVVASALTSTLPVAAAVAPTDSVYLPVTPQRVLAFAPLGPGSTHTLRVPGVPAGATAVALNVTATGVRDTASTYVSACAAGTPLATCRSTSAFNPAAGEDTPAAVLVALGGASGDEVTFYNDTGSILLVADLQGFYVPAGPGSAYSPVAPRRVLSFQPMGPADALTLTLPDVPAGATAVALNLTSVGASTSSYVSACPAGQSLADCTTSSVLNPFPGRDLANFAVVKLGGPAGDQVTLYNNAGTVSLVADVAGYFTTAGGAPDAGRFRPVAPVRALAFHRLGAGHWTTLTLPGVPSGATAVAMNVTTTATTTQTFVSTCPGGTALASCVQSSTLNPRAGVDSANNVMLKLGGPYRNQVTFYNNSGATSVIADVQGYFVGTAPTTDPPVVAPAAPSSEERLLARVNQVRAEAGLAPLTHRLGLTDVAEAWTWQMAGSGTLAHNPSISEQIEPGWSTWGENVGYASGYPDDTEKVFTSWMDSPGHRANILNPRFNSIGIGATVDGNGRLWATQVFAAYS